MIDYDQWRSFELKGRREKAIIFFVILYNSLVCIVRLQPMLDKEKFIRYNFQIMLGNKFLFKNKSNHT